MMGIFPQMVDTLVSNRLGQHIFHRVWSHTCLSGRMSFHRPTTYSPFRRNIINLCQQRGLKSSASQCLSNTCIRPHRTSDMKILWGRSGLCCSVRQPVIRDGLCRPYLVSVRLMSGNVGRASNRSTAIYILSVFILMVGMSYAGVPLYRMICQATGLGGTVNTEQDAAKIEAMSAVKDRKVKIRFNADTASSMQWHFRPQQFEILVYPGETALAFYRAKNPTDKPIIGISTYNVVPFESGQYFNKIQCFCFEEQRLNPQEEVDMPVFFFIDPEFAEDPLMEDVDIITLSYTFFEAKPDLKLPLPGYS